APSPMTSRPGRNLSVAGFGVDSVCMNMRRLLSSSVKALHGPRCVANQHPTTVAWPQSDLQKSEIRPFRSQSPYRVGSRPLGPPISLGLVPRRLCDLDRRSSASANARTPASRIRFAISSLLAFEGMVCPHPLDAPLPIHT